MAPGKVGGILATDRCPVEFLMSNLTITQRMGGTYLRKFGADFIFGILTNLFGPGDNYHPDDSEIAPALIRHYHGAKLNGDARVTGWRTGAALREILYVNDYRLRRERTTAQAAGPVKDGRTRLEGEAPCTWMAAGTSPMARFERLTCLTTPCASGVDESLDADPEGCASQNARVNES